MKKEFPLATASRLSVAYYEMTWMNLAATMYDFYEGYRDTNIALSEEGAKLTEEFLGFMKPVLSETMLSSEERENTIEALMKLRKTITAQVEATTSYTDRLAVYEHLLNRAEYGFKENLPEKDDEEEARKLLQYIFNTEDNAVVNMRIRDMVSQLPVRMTKARFFDLVNGSLGIYEGTDEASLQGFLYMLLSAAGIRKEDADTVTNEEYEQLISYLNGFDFSNLTKEEFDEMTGRMELVTDGLSVAAESFVSLQSVVNFLLAILLIEKPEYENSDSRKAMLPILTEVTENFANALSGGMDVEVSEASVERFAYLEGRLEKLSQQVLRDEGKLDEYLAEETETSEEVTRLGMAKKLIGTSNFVSFEEQDKTVVDKARIEEARKEVCDLLDASFDGKDRRFVRAIMAQVLKELPVFFNSHNEVMNYVVQSLKSCRDLGEKTASIDMLWAMFE